eukprot:m.252745 g.252745  ORF g.252745 m.252745 type:complete len:397 (-) comp26514_c3_seq22:2170-3360(-)
MTAVLPGPHPDAMDPRMRRFWSCSLTVGEALPWNPWWPQDSSLVYGLHVSQVCLDPKAEGRHVIICIVTGEDGDLTSVIAILDANTRPQQQLSFFFGEPMIFVLEEGEGPVHISGTKVLIGDLSDKMPECDTGCTKACCPRAGMDGDCHKDEDEMSLQMLEGLTDIAEGKDISEAAQEILQAAAMGEVVRRSKDYFGSALELAGLVETYKKCCGCWDFVLKFQAGSNEDELARYKGMIKKLVKSNVLKKVSKYQQTARRTELEEADTETDLDSVEDESEDDGEDCELEVDDQEEDLDDDDEDDDDDESGDGYDTGDEMSLQMIGCVDDGNEDDTHLPKVCRHSHAIILIKHPRVERVYSRSVWYCGAHTLAPRPVPIVGILVYRAALLAVVLRIFV